MDEHELYRPANSASIEQDVEGSNGDNSNNDGHLGDELTRNQAWCLYISHFLSMWTSRAYEYMAILFIQYTFPGDLLPSSINGIAETVCVLVSSAALGRWVDQSPSRLKPLVTSILVNRVTLVACCIIWLFMFASSNVVLLRTIFGVLLILGMVEKASRMSNYLSIERDWIPTIATYGDIKENLAQTDYDLTHLNTVIQRIDMICKFLAPLVASSLMALVRPWVAATLIGSFSLSSCFVEIWSLLSVWKYNGRLQKAKAGLVPGTTPTHNPHGSISSKLLYLKTKLIALVQIQADGLSFYFGSDVWIPSLGVAILHASVLTWSGTLITWLLNSGFTYVELSVSKGVGSIFDLGSTFLFPFAVNFFLERDSFTSAGGSYQLVGNRTNGDGEKQSDDDGAEGAQVAPAPGALGAIVATAQWSILGLITCLLPTLAALLVLERNVGEHVDTSKPAMSLKRLTSKGSASEGTTDLFTISPIAMTIFLAFLSISFLGRWTYHLSISQLTQLAIPARHRSEFGGTEMSIVSLVSLSHWVAATIWHRQSDFKWLAVGSVGAVAVATGGYCYWAIRWRQQGQYRPGH